MWQLQRASPPAGHWHWFHLPVSIFLVAFALTEVAELLAWTDLRAQVKQQLTAAFGLGDAWVTPAIAGMKGGALLLGLIALIGLLRREDIWIVFAIAGWLPGFYLLGVTAMFAGELGRLAVHVVFLMIFTGLLIASSITGAKEGYREPAGDRGAGPGTPGG